MRGSYRQGDTIVWIARPSALEAGESIGANWNCRAGLFDEAGAEAVEPFTVTEKQVHAGEEHFVISIDRDQSTDLAVGKYRLAIDIWNSTVSPPYSRETIIEVQVQQQLVQNT